VHSSCAGIKYNSTVGGAFCLLCVRDGEQIVSFGARGNGTPCADFNGSYFVVGPYSMNVVFVVDEWTIMVCV
jgi:hypothetical protein